VRAGTSGPTRRPAVPQEATDALLTETARDAVAGYERRLRDSDSRIVRDPRAHTQLLEQAAAVVRDVLTGLSGRAGVMDDEQPLCDEIGADRALAGLHPRESLAAAELLFEEVLGVVARSLPGRSRAEGADQETDLEILQRAAVLLNRSILDRIGTASVSYAAFLLTRAQEAHAEERLRVSRELHDHAAHEVAAAMQRVELAQLRAGNQQENLSAAADRLQVALEHIRSVSTELRDSVPAHGGLRAALAEYLRGHAGPGVHTTLSVEGDLERLPAGVTEEVFLAVREAIRNALAHSGTAVLDVDLTIRDDTLLASVRDRGRGFDPSGDIGQANGLATIRERCALVGGRSSVTSTVGVGTRVEIVVPVGAA
jgi:signal transduction histidine kinase